MFLDYQNIIIFNNLHYCIDYVFIKYINVIFIIVKNIKVIKNGYPLSNFYKDMGMS